MDAFVDKRKPAFKHALSGGQAARRRSGHAASACRSASKQRAPVAFGVQFQPVDRPAPGRVTTAKCSRAAALAAAWRSHRCCRAAAATGSRAPPASSSAAPSATTPPGPRSRTPAAPAAAIASPARRDHSTSVPAGGAAICAHLGAARVGVDSSVRVGGVQVAQHHAARVGLVTVDGGQHRHAPGVALVAPRGASSRQQSRLDLRPAVSHAASSASLRAGAVLRPLGPARRSQDSRRSAGNRITSRMLGLSVSSMISRSMPMPQPPAGGMPYSSARMKSAS